MSIGPTSAASAGEPRAERAALAREREREARFGRAADALERRVLGEAEQLAKVQLRCSARSPRLLAERRVDDRRAGRCAANCSHTYAHFAHVAAPRLRARCTSA